MATVSELVAAVSESIEAVPSFVPLCSSGEAEEAAAGVVAGDRVLLLTLLPGGGVSFLVGEGVVRRLTRTRQFLGMFSEGVDSESGIHP